jgi:Protein of unknwon function (DUF3310)
MIDNDTTLVGTTKSNVSKFKRDEDRILIDTLNYIESTYKQHYVGKTEIQTVDVWDSLGSTETTCRDTAIKYLMRFGKKDGRNYKDLMKAIHYTVLMFNAAEQNDKNGK